VPARPVDGIERPKVAPTRNPTPVVKGKRRSRTTAKHARASEEEAEVSRAFEYLDQELIDLTGSPSPKAKPKTKGSPKGSPKGGGGISRGAVKKTKGSDSAAAGPLVVGPLVVQLPPTPPSGVTVRKRSKKAASPPPHEEEKWDQAYDDQAYDQGAPEMASMEEEAEETPPPGKRRRSGWSELQQRVASILRPEGELAEAGPIPPTSPPSGSKKRARKSPSKSPERTPGGSTPGKRRLFKQPRPSQLPDEMEMEIE